MDNKKIICLECKYGDMTIKQNKRIEISQASWYNFLFNFSNLFYLDSYSMMKPVITMEMIVLKYLVGSIIYFCIMQVLSEIERLFTK